MIDPNNVLLQCPNGHELQAARADIHQDLACPVCSVVFTPQVPRDPVPGPFNSAQSSVAMQYAVRGAIGGRAAYPGYTGWMIVLWIVGALMLGALTIYSALVQEDYDPAKPSTGMLAGALGVLCLGLPAAIAAIVLNLIWIHRVHKDAEAYGGYNGISPGMALGISFIPIANLIWIAWTLHKLGQFSSEGERQSDPAAMRGAHAARTCLIVAVVLTAIICITTSIMFVSSNHALKEAQAEGLKLGTPEYARRIQELTAFPPAITIGDMLIRMLSVLVYLYTVRAVETSLYTKLGAIPRN